MWLLVSFLPIHANPEVPPVADRVVPNIWIDLLCTIYIDKVKSLNADTSSDERNTHTFHTTTIQLISIIQMAYQTKSIFSILEHVM